LRAVRAIPETGRLHSPLKPCRESIEENGQRRRSAFILNPGGASKKQNLKIEALMAVGVVLHVHFVEHGGGGGVSFFVGVDRRDVLQARADVIEAFEQDFLA